MKILFLTNNPGVSLPLFEWIKNKEGADNVVLYSEKLMASQFSTDEPFCDIEFVISYNYSHIIKQDVISLFPHRIINLHTSMLPWNKGTSSNIWSFLEGTPSGVTIHEIDAGIDSGDILLQREIVFDFKAETLKSSYEKSHELMRKLFCDNWDKIKKGLIKPKKQHGTIHFKKDSQMFDHVINYNDTINEFIQKYTELSK
jgi:methionyl-tRNA formyltransferase